MNRLAFLRWPASALLAGTLALGPAGAAEPALTLKPCRLPGVEHEAQCGVLRRPLDPSNPDGTQIDLHVAVLPAVARNKKPDPVLFFAGGPGQSALDIGARNVTLAQKLLAEQSIPIVGRDTGGPRGRRVIFHTDTGNTWVWRL